MAKAHLTKRFIDKTPFATGKTPTIFWDTELKGYALKVTRTRKNFFAQARVNQKLRRVTLGAYGALTPSQARDMAKDELLKMIKGVDPSITREHEKIHSVTMEQIVESYLNSKKLKPLSIKDINTHKNLNFKDWKKRPMSGITRQEVKNRFQGICERSPAQANQAFRVFRAWWNYAKSEYRDPETDESIFSENPVAILSEQNLWSKIKPRDGKVPLDKVGKAWNVLKELMESPVQTPAGRTIADATGFILLIGCRLNEAVTLTWDHVNIEDKWWHLDDPKNHRAVTFPLSKIACQIIESRPKINEFVFASRGKHGHITEIRTPMAKISKAINYKVSAHDLRRTFKAIAVENQIENGKAT